LKVWKKRDKEDPSGEPKGARMSVPVLEQGTNRIGRRECTPESFPSRWQTHQWGREREKKGGKKGRINGGRTVKEELEERTSKKGGTEMIDPFRFGL